MARKPLKSQLNQIRSWVRQGRTDAWIAHQLEVSTTELREFRKRHELNAEDDDAAQVDLRDEIEAEIEAELEAEAEEAAAAAAAAAAEAEAKAAAEREAAEAKAPASSTRSSRSRSRAKTTATTAAEGGEDHERESSRSRSRRRGRRRGRRSGAGLEATFDHGDRDGYGLWLDPAVTDDPIYAENWKGHRQVEVTIEPDRIVIRRSDADAGATSQSQGSSQSQPRQPR